MKKNRFGTDDAEPWTIRIIQFFGRAKMRMKLSDWVVAILIAIFFAIPVCSLTISQTPSIWPKCSTAFVYNLFLR